MAESSKKPLERHLDPLREPFREFISAQTTAGAFLMLALVFALLLFNLGGREWYEALSALPLGIFAGSWRTFGSLLYWTNHALISLFFS